MRPPATPLRRCVLSRPRIRTIKPELWQSRDFQTLSATGRLTFVSLISNADDEGRLATDAGHIATTALTGCMPDEIAVQLERMEERRMVMAYRHRGERFLAVMDYTGDAPWSQRIDHPKPSDLPAPPKFKRLNVPQVLPLGAAIHRRIPKQTYFLLRSDNHVKIGLSRNVTERQVSLEAAAGPLTLLAVIEGNKESWYHSTFAALRTSGEWFRYEDPLRSHIAELVAVQEFQRGLSVNKVPIEIKPGATTREPVCSNGADRTVPDRTVPDRKPPEGSPAKAVELALVGEVDSLEGLFNAWVESTGHRRAVFTDRRRALIRTRLKEGWSIADLRLVVTEGWRNDPWPERVQHVEFELLLRDSAHVEKFLKLAQDGPPSQKATPTALDMRTRQLLAEADELRRGGK